MMTVCIILNNLQVILVLVFVGLIFIPIGLACIAASNKVRLNCACYYYSNW